MYSFYSGWHERKCPNFNETTDTFQQRRTLVEKDRNVYMTHLNHQLITETRNAEHEKNLYKNQLNFDQIEHQTEIGEAMRLTSQKNAFILKLQQKLDHCHKENRILTRDLENCKGSTLVEKDRLKTQLEEQKQHYEQKIKAIEEKHDLEIELKIGNKILQIENQCEDRIKMYKRQIEIVEQNSTQYAHDLKLLQDRYRQLLVKNDVLTEERIHRELRKRDYEADEIQVRDKGVQQGLKTQKQQLQTGLLETKGIITSLKKENTRLNRQLSTTSKRLKDIELAFQSEKDKYQKSILEQTKPTLDITNDLGLISEVVSCKEFLNEKIVERFLQFFSTAEIKEANKTHSLIIFKNAIEELKDANPEVRILLFLQTSLERICRLYCPVGNHQQRNETVKDELIRKTVMDCQKIQDNCQQLYRLVEMVHRLKFPVNNQHGQVSTEELRQLQNVLLSTLKKVFR